MQRYLTIDGRFLTQNPTGVQRYAREIVAELDIQLQNEPLRSSLSAKILVPAGAANQLNLSAITWQRSRFPIRGPLWTQLVLPAQTQGVLLSLANVGPLIVSNQIVCIHDANICLAPESYSSLFRVYYGTVLPTLAKRAAHVVTVSKFSARMLHEFGLCPLEKITVIPNGHEHVKHWRPERSAYASPSSHRRPFVFVLGSRALHKNVKILYSIAKELDALGLDLLAAGGTYKHFSAIEGDKVPSNVRMLGFVSDDDLAALYQNAFCFAFPSLTEGFGLPALEALALGCPVIASDCASLPEVCGDAALYANPNSPGAWLDQIRRLHADPKLSANLRAEGPRRAKRFSWTQSATLYLDLIRSTLPQQTH